MAGILCEGSNIARPPELSGKGGVGAAATRPEPPMPYFFIFTRVRGEERGKREAGCGRELNWGRDWWRGSVISRMLGAGGGVYAILFDATVFGVVGCRKWEFLRPRTSSRVSLGDTIPLDTI
jgi:hypothetical protein